MNFEVNHTGEAEANWFIANNSCYIIWGRLSAHGQPSLMAQMFHMLQVHQNKSRELSIVLELQGTKYDTSWGNIGIGGTVIVVSYHPSLLEVARVSWANNSHTHIPTHTGLIWSCATEHCFCAVKFLERLYKTLPQFAIFAEKVEFIEALVATLMSPSMKGDKLSSDT